MSDVMSRIDLQDFLPDGCPEYPHDTEVPCGPRYKQNNRWLTQQMVIDKLTAHLETLSVLMERGDNLTIKLDVRPGSKSGQSEPADSTKRAYPLGAEGWGGGS